MYLWIIGVMLAATSAALLSACILGTVIAGARRDDAPAHAGLHVVDADDVDPDDRRRARAARRHGAAVLRERVYGGVFRQLGGPIQYQNLLSFSGHPVVYIVVFFPFVGAVGEVIAVFSRKRFFGYRAHVAALLLLPRCRRACGRTTCSPPARSP